jgi:hypothetical protein
MYVIEKGADGHKWEKESYQPHPDRFKKLFCTQCGCKAYTIKGTNRLSLTGEYYSGEITACPGGSKKLSRLNRGGSEPLKRTKLKRSKKRKLKRSKS